MSLESSEEFLRLFERVSKSIIFWGCGVSKDVEGCIEKRIRSALRHRKRQHKEAKSEKDKRFFKNKIRKLNNLLEHDFANRVDRSSALFYTRDPKNNISGTHRKIRRVQTPNKGRKEKCPNS